MKDELRRVICAFNRHECSIAQLKADLLELIKHGVKSSLSPTEIKHFDDLFIGYVDMYDEKLQPRSGAGGAMLDIVDQVFRGNHRISLDQVCDATKRFERVIDPASAL